MSQEQQSRPNEQGSPERVGNGPQRKRDECFEGMNYEQRRQPYQPRQGNKNNGRNDERGNRKHEA